MAPTSTLALDPVAPEGREIFRRVQQFLDRKYGSAPSPSARQRGREAQRTAAYISYVLEEGTWLAPPTLAQASVALGESERSLRRRRALAREVMAEAHR